MDCTVNEEVKEWMIKTYKDYITAKYLISLHEDEIITSTVCFHSQQFEQTVQGDEKAAFGDKGYYK